ncbi:MAG: hypothetical protein ACRDWI_13190 [Jiangellaceae bacterium]
MPKRDLPAWPRGLIELIEIQHGVVSVNQLVDWSVGVDLAQARAASGRWQRPHRGVYATFSGGLDRPAELDGLTDVVDENVHVTVPAHRRVRGRYAGIVVHYARRLDESRRPGTSPPRTRIVDTVLDLVDTARTARAAEAWIATACQKRLTTPDRLAESLMRRKKIGWRAMAEAMLLDVAEGAHSMLELAFLRSVERAHGLPRGDRQRRRTGRRVIWIDVDYEPYQTRAELDGRLGHDGDGRFRDRRRDNRATVDGAWSLRYGHAEVFGTPCSVAAELALVLRDRGWTGRARPCGDGCAVTAAQSGDHRHFPAA